MRKHFPLLGAVLAVAVSLSAVPPAAVQAAPRRPYVNPFADPLWEPSRTDMGMDWVPVRKLPVLAVGDAVILGADNHSGPGKHIIWYQLTDGSHAGDIIYVAEHLKNLARPGTVVRAGQQIALALPGYPWIETGWADQYGSPRAAAIRKAMPRTRVARWSAS
jgi:murein DD-endopeptidase MepM/ murein hydrolase activator NlpD